MRVVLTNTVCLNGGDAAIAFGIVRILRRALGDDMSITIFDKNGYASSRLHPRLRWRPSLFSRPDRLPPLPLVRRGARALSSARLRLAVSLRRDGRPGTGLLLGRGERRDLETYATADLVVSTGGTYLVEQYSLRRVLDELELALALGAPLVLFTQSLGPFRDPENRRRLRAIIDRALIVLVRDEASRRHVAELGARTDHVHVRADAAFALADAGDERPEPMPVARPRPLRIAVSVRQWSHFRTVPATEGMARFRDAVGAMVSHLVERHGADVTFLSTCQGVPEYWTDDSRVATEITASLPASVGSHVSVDREHHAPERLLARLATFDLVIATRMHMAILALAAGTPVLAIAYEFKTRELFESLGLGAWLADIETLTAADGVRALDQLLPELDATRTALVSLVARERARAFDAGTLVADALRSTPGRS